MCDKLEHAKYIFTVTSSRNLSTDTVFFKSDNDIIDDPNFLQNVLFIDLNLIGGNVVGMKLDLVGKMLQFSRGL